MAAGIFFNGQQYISPAVASAVNDSALLPTGTANSGVLALVGASAGGQPNTVLTFGSAQDVVNTLVSGDLVDAATRAFAPSSEVDGPAQIIVVRVNPATQSTLTLNDGAGNPTILMNSTDYGQRTTQVKVKVETGTTAGLKLTTAIASTTYSQDNVSRNVFQIGYAGTAASAAMSIVGDTLTLYAPVGTVADTISLAAYPTVQQLVDRINADAGFSATVQGGNGAAATLNALDYVTNQDVMTAQVIATANLQAAVDWFNGVSEGLVDAVRAPNAGQPPALIGFTYLAGGSDGVITNVDWSNAFETLQYEDVSWLTPLSGDPSIHAMADAHCVFMSNTMRSERRALVGPVVGTSDTTALGLALGLNSDRTGLTHLGGYDFDANGDLTLYAPYVVAAMIAGGFAGSSPGTPMTNKSLALKGMERKLRNPVDTDPLISGGVIPVESTTDGFNVVQSVSTWLNDNRYDKVELSTGAAVDYIAKTVRAALAPLKGQKGGPTLLSQAVSLTQTALAALAVPDPLGPGVIVGDTNSPAFTGITASISGDAVSVQFQCSPVIPNNFVLISISAVPYAGTASA
ncbi:MAG: hypothetical protein WA840_12780 [Caulobacteraceae bacterium]